MTPRRQERNLEQKAGGGVTADTEIEARLAEWADDVQLSNRVGVPHFANPRELKDAIRDVLAALRSLRDERDTLAEALTKEQVGHDGQKRLQEHQYARAKRLDDVRLAALAAVAAAIEGTSENLYLAHRILANGTPDGNPRPGRAAALSEEPPAEREEKR